VATEQHAHPLTLALSRACWSYLSCHLHQHARCTHRTRNTRVHTHTHTHHVTRSTQHTAHAVHTNANSHTHTHAHTHTHTHMSSRSFTPTPPPTRTRRRVQGISRRRSQASQRSPRPIYRAAVVTARQPRHVAHNGATASSEIRRRTRREDLRVHN
jgi:hypothetical protein